MGPALEAARILEEQNISSTVINARFVKPLDESLIRTHAEKAKVVVTIEEGCLSGGFGAAVLESLTEKNVNLQKTLCLGIPDQFIEPGARNILLDLIGLTPEKIAQSARQTLARLTPEHPTFSSQGKISPFPATV